MTLVKGLGAYVAVACASAMFSGPAAVELWESVEAAMLVCSLGPLVAVVAIGRRTFGRPYLRKQTVIAAALAPVLAALAILAVLYRLELAGAGCSRSGLDYISQCNDLAFASMLLCASNGSAALA